MGDVGFNPEFFPPIIQKKLPPSPLVSPFPKSKEGINVVRYGSSESKPITRTTPNTIDNPTILDSQNDLSLRGETRGKSLSPREKESLTLASRYFLEGGGNVAQSIADELGISFSNVRNVLAHAREKLDVSTTAGAIEKAKESGVIAPQGLEQTYDTSRLGKLTMSERSIFLALASAGEEEGYAQVAYSMGMTEQNLKNYASRIWKKLGITRRQLKSFSEQAANQKNDRAVKDGTNPEEVDVFYGIKLPERPPRKKLSPVLSQEAIHALTLFAYGLVETDIAKILGVSVKAVTRYKRNAKGVFNTSTIVDTVVRAMEEDIIDPAEIIPEDFESKIERLIPRDKEIFYTVANNPDEPYYKIGKDFNLAEDTIKARSLVIFAQVGLSSRIHAAIVNRAMHVNNEKKAAA